MPGFDIRKEETRALVQSWLAASGGDGRVLAAGTDALDPGDAAVAAGALAEAGAAYGRALGDRREDPRALFALGTVHLRAGRVAEALRLWHRAYLLDPSNFLVRKQIWRMLYPERFGDPIDLDWQKEQMQREAELGFSAANPRLPVWRPE